MRRVTTYIMINTCISDTGKESYKLTALIDEGKYSMPSLEFSGLKEKLSSNEMELLELQDYWDAEEYLLETLFPILKMYTQDKKIENVREFQWIIKHIPVEDFQLVYDILQCGIEEGFFQDYFNKRSKIDE